MTPEPRRTINAKGWLKLILAIVAGLAGGIWLSVHFPLPLLFWG
jgi:hypothetical protein